MIAGIPTSDLIAAAAIGAAFLGLMAVAELWSRVGHAKPEWTRKLVHVAGGLICLSFPFVLESPWTVLVLASLMTALFAVGAEFGFLHSLHRVKRRSRGSEYYPLSVFLVFMISLGRPWLFVASMLTLAVADGFAALIGMKYGRIRYEVESETKSLEGSLAFMLIAFVAILSPLLVMTDLPLSVCLGAALLVAMVVTGFEAVCLTGTDNLFVPIGVAVILSKITTKPLPEILYQNLSLIALLGTIAFLAYRSHAMNVGGALTLGLFTYGAWSLGSEIWAAPALVGFAIYILACITKPLHASLKVTVVFRAVLIPLILLVANNMFRLGSTFYLPFVASLIAVLALSLWNHARARPGVNLSPEEIWSARHLGITALAAIVALALQSTGLIHPGFAL